MSSDISAKFFREACVLHMLSSVMTVEVPLLEALSLAADFDVNMEAAFGSARSEVGNGGVVSTELAKYPNLFSEFTPFLVLLGEKTDTLDQTLLEVARISLRLSELVEAGRAPEMERVLVMTDFIALSHLILGMQWSPITALKFLADHSCSKNREAWDKVYAQVEAGNSLSVAMESVGGVFPVYAIRMIRAGEARGGIDVTIDCLALHIVFKVLQTQR